MTESGDAETASVSAAQAFWRERAAINTFLAQRDRPDSAWTEVQTKITSAWLKVIDTFEKSESVHPDNVYDHQHRVGHALQLLGETEPETRLRSADISTIANNLRSSMSTVDRLAEAYPDAVRAVWAHDHADIEADLRVIELSYAALARIEDLAAEASKAAKAAIDSADETRAASEAAIRAAGTAGTSAIETSYTAYAAGERKAAQWFRRWTIFVLIVTVAVALGSVIASISWPEVVGADAAALAYRLAAFAGLAALAAYLGRQASHHRRAAVWAEAIAVQLRSWDAFITPLEDSQAKASMYEIFGRRVLGSPPEVNAKAVETANPLITPLIDAVTKLNRT